MELFGIFTGSLLVYWIFALGEFAIQDWASNTLIVFQQWFEDVSEEGIEQSLQILCQFTKDLWDYDFSHVEWKTLLDFRLGLAPPDQID